MYKDTTSTPLGPHLAEPLNCLRISAVVAAQRLESSLDNPAEHFNFGYNNRPPPDPSAPSGAYGYEVMITVESEVEPEGEVKIKQIPGGLYAVARCKGTDNIYPTWSYMFHEWLRTNGRYELDEENEAGLEEHLDPSEEKPERWVFDLYLPVRLIVRTP